MGILFRIKKNRRYPINNGARFYTIKFLWRTIKIQEIKSPKIGDSYPIRTLKFRHKRDAEKAIKKIKIKHIWQPINWRHLLDIDYF